MPYVFTDSGPYGLHLAIPNSTHWSVVPGGCPNGDAMIQPADENSGPYVIDSNNRINMNNFDDWALFFWCRWADCTNDRIIANYSNFGTTAANQQQWRINFMADETVLFHTFWSGSGGGPTKQRKSSILTSFAGQKVFVAINVTHGWDATGAQPDIYINTVLSNGASATSFNAINNYTPNNTLQLGYTGDANSELGESAPGTAFFQMGKLGVLKRKLTLAEISNLYLAMTAV